MRSVHVVAGILIGGVVIALMQRLQRKKYIEARQPAALVIAAAFMLTTLAGFLFELAEYLADHLYFGADKVLSNPYNDIEGQLCNLLGAAVAVAIFFFYNKRMNNKMWTWLSAVIGIGFIALAFFYWMTPAGSLPHFFPGFIAGSTVKHFKHGLGSFVLGLGAFALAWFKSGKKSATA
jgi:hypothetical protein